ncbi:hypothetical protein AHAS_Ahas03G0055000 [Arachis hypogaea]
MAFRIPGIRKASLSASKGTNVPKGYLAVYVGDKMRRFVIPLLSCLINLFSAQMGAHYCPFNLPSSLLKLQNLNLTAFSNLVTLYLPRMCLTGIIPAEIVLDVSFNSLSATIRSKLGEFKNLTFLSLASNRIEGPIQQQLGTLRDLQELPLSNRRSCCRE